MQIQVLKSKVHRARVTGAALNYAGSLTVSADLLEAAGIVPYERILCGNLSNGHRFETYAIAGETGAGAVILNGATAHLGKIGDRLTVMSFATISKDQAGQWRPRIITLDEENRVAAPPETLPAEA